MFSEGRRISFRLVLEDSGSSGLYALDHLDSHASAAGTWSATETALSAITTARRSWRGEACGCALHESLTRLPVGEEIANEPDGNVALVCTRLGTAATTACTLESGGAAERRTACVTAATAAA